MDETLVVGIDFETTWGADPEMDQIIEIGAVTWDTSTGRPIKMLSEFILPLGVTELNQRATKLTGITVEMLNEFGTSTGVSLRKLLEFVGKIKYVCAHNAPFDKSIFENECERLNIPLPNWHWIDSSKDIPFPESIKTRKLIHLAAEHNFLNPFAHRAVFDVLTMMTIFKHYDFETIKKWSHSPSIKIKAEVTDDERRKASDRGYRWDEFNKFWFKEIKELELENEIKDCEFPVKVMKRWT